METGFVEVVVMETGVVVVEAGIVVVVGVVVLVSVVMATNVVADVVEGRTVVTGIGGKGGFGVIR